MYNSPQSISTLKEILPPAVAIQVMPPPGDLRVAGLNLYEREQ
jgi:hypothetical protein